MRCWTIATRSTRPPPPSSPQGDDDPRAWLDAIMLRSSRQPEIRLYSVLGAEALDANHPAHAYFNRRYEASRADLERVLAGHVRDPAGTAVHVLAVACEPLPLLVIMHKLGVLHAWTTPAREGGR